MTEELHQIPKTWVWTNVDTLYKVIGGGTPSTKIARYWNGDIPWITSADINDVKTIVPRKYITKEAIKNSATKLVPTNSIIVVTRVGLGKVALTEYPLCFSQDSQALVGDNLLINPNYSVYYLSTAVQEFKYKHRGTTIAGVPRKQLKQLLFPLPPHNEQVRIVNRVEELFNQIEVAEYSLKKILLPTSKQKGLVDSLKKSILKKGFQGRLVPQDPNDEPANILLERIESNKTKQRKLL